MNGFCTHKNGITTATKYCPECGRLGLEVHETEHFSIQGGNLIDSSSLYFVCPTCGYSGDGELVPPEVRDINDLDIYEGDDDTIEEEFPLEDGEA